MCGRVRLSCDYSEIKIKLKFAPNSPAPNYASDWNKPLTEPMLVATRARDRLFVSGVQPASEFFADFAAPQPND